MNVIYALRDDMARNARELRYSLRSLAMHLPEATPMVCGPNPDWYTGDHWPLQDHYGTHQKNMTAKLRKILEVLTSRSSTGSDRAGVIWMCDDYFLMKEPIKEHRYGLALRDTVANLQRQRHEREWTRLCMEETLEFLLDNGINEPLNYVTHTPFWMRMDLAMEAMEICMRSRTGMELATIYGNLYDEPNDRFFGPDVKIRSVKAALVMGHRTNSFSTDPAMEDDPMTEARLQELFPDPSPWEEGYSIND